MAAMAAMAVMAAAAAALLALTGAGAAEDTAPGARFEDRTAALGLAGFGADSGACWLDFDRDGWADLCAGGVLWRGEGKGKRFARVAEPSHCVAADFDNDGYPDLYSWSKRVLYRNDRGKGLVPVPLPAEVAASVSRGACWADFDGDGFADLYVGGYEDWEKNVTYPSFVLRNDRGRGFTVAATDARYRARGVTACDFDRDGDADVYVSNYRLQPNLLLVNDGRGALADRAADLGAVATTAPFRGGHSIGACWGDFDGDGHLDLFAGNFAHRDSRGDQPQSRFLRNPGRAGAPFEDRGAGGVFYQESYASPAAGDADNDGDLDLFFTTVYATASFRRPNHPALFDNGGGFAAFRDATEASGLAKIGPTYQAAWSDFDRDGDLDLVTGGRLYVNTSPPDRRARRWLAVRLEGDGERVNRDAIGAQVRVRLRDGRFVTRQVEAGTGEGNQNDPTLHLGLGADRAPAYALEILWPDGTKQTVTRLSPNRLVTVRYRRR